MLLFSRSQSAKVPRQVCHAEDEMEKDSRERELWNSPCVQLPKMTLIRESEMDRALPSNVAGTRNCGYLHFLCFPAPVSSLLPCHSAGHVSVCATAQALQRGVAEHLFDFVLVLLCWRLCIKAWTWQQLSTLLIYPSAWQLDHWKWLAEYHHPRAYLVSFMFISCCLLLNFLMFLFCPLYCLSSIFFQPCPDMCFSKTIFAFLINLFFCALDAQKLPTFSSHSLIFYFFPFVYFVLFLSKSYLSPLLPVSPLHPSPTLLKKCINLPSFLCWNKLINERFLFVLLS